MFVHIRKRLRSKDLLVLYQAKRFVSDKVSLPFTVSAVAARSAFDRYHRNPLTSSPSVESVQQKYVPFYFLHVTSQARYRASIGRSMNVPFRDPQTGRVIERQRIVWTTLQPQYTPPITTEYSEQDSQSQIYAGFEQYEEQMNIFLPIPRTQCQPHKLSNIPDESYNMTEEFAAKKVQERVSEHLTRIIKEALHQQHGSMVKVDQITVDLKIHTTTKALYPLWIFKHTGHSLRTLVSGFSAKVSAIKVYDATLAGGAVGSLTAFITFFLLHSPLFSLVLLFISSFLAHSAAKYYPIWITMRMEGRRAADMLANQRYGTSDQQDQGPSGFNPFEFFGGQFGQGAFNFDPFATGGNYQGQRRSSDPFYGSDSRRQRSQGPTASKPAADLYAILGVSRTASQDDITNAFRKLALTRHPDKVPAAEKAQASKDFSKINEAYRVLRNRGKRDQYDRYGVVS